jgi:hypothetical protein
MVKDLTESLVSFLIDTFNKVLIELPETAGAFYLLGTDWVAAGDYSIKQYCYYDGDVIRLHGNINDFGSRALIDANGAIFWSPEQNTASSVTTSNGVVPVNKFSFLEVTRIGSVGKIYLNGTLVITSTVTTGSAVVNTIGNHKLNISGGLFSQPTLTDLTTPSNSLPFELNKLTGNFELPVGNVFGSELVTIAPNTFGTNASNVINNITTNGFDFVGNGNSFFGVEYGAFLINGDSYEITGNAAIAGGAVKVQTQGGVNASFGVINSSGAFRFIARSDGTELVFGRDVNGQVIDVSILNLSVRKVTNVITYQNIPESARDTYTLIGANYFGSERVVNGNFATDSSWSKSGATISGGAVNFTGDGQFISQTLLALSTTYEITYTVLSSNRADGLFTDRGTSCLEVNLPSGVGQHTVIATTSATGSLEFYISALLDGVGFTGSVTNVSVKRYIEVA